MSMARVAGSFRDPAGFVFTRDGRLLRQVNRVHADTWDAVAASDLFPALWEAGVLVHHDVVDTGLGTDDAHVVIEPERLPLLSQPHEWAPGQLRAAALGTLEVQRIALDHGMILRDASAHNIQFHRGRAVFIDTLSFEPIREGKPWIAHGQFCEHFLAPLALQTIIDPRLRRLLVGRLDGVELDLASAMLPDRSWLRFGLLQHLHLHARARGKPTNATAADGPRREATFSHNALVGVVNSLRRSIEKLRYTPSGTVWGDYYDEVDHYADAAMAAKVGLVREHVRTVAPAVVWDLGANTGRFSRLAVEEGAATVAWDIDVGAVEKAWQEVSAGEPRDLLPLVLDLTNPSPGLGWAHRERESLADRGPVDLVMALALVHHLSIGSNVPLDDVVAELARLGRHVVFEWVPKGDPKVDVLLSTREDVFTDYTREVLVAAIERHFTVLAVDPLPDSDRELFLLRRLDD